MSDVTDLNKNEHFKQSMNNNKDYDTAESIKREQIKQRLLADDNFIKLLDALKTNKEHLEKIFMSLYHPVEGYEKKDVITYTDAFLSLLLDHFVYDYSVDLSLKLFENYVLGLEADIDMSFKTSIINSMSDLRFVSALVDFSGLASYKDIVMDIEIKRLFSKE